MTDDTPVYRHRCDFCETTIQGATLAEVQRLGRRHLQEDHYAEFEEVFVDQMSGKPCLDECGYTFPAEAAVDGFECPNCGFDNFPEFAERHVWWRVELDG